MPAAILQPATDPDLPAVVQLMNRAFRGKGSKAGWSTEADYIEGDRTTLPLLQDQVASTPDGHLLIARDAAAQSLQGSVWLHQTSPLVWYLGSLTVDPTLQNAGTGRQLLAAAEQWLLERGAKLIQMRVVNVRETLIAWYVRRGYHLPGETHPFPYDDHRFGRPLRNDLAFVVLEKSFR